MTALPHASLKFGDVVQLESVLGGRKRYRVQLLGLLPGVTVMVTAPEADGIVVPFVQGQSYVVRVFTGDAALAFQSRVVHRCKYPLSYLHLAYPESVEKVLVRNTRRTRLRLPARVQLAAGETVEVIIDDLSTDGAQLESRSELGAINEHIVITASFMLDRIGERSVTLPAELKNLKSYPGEDGGTLHHYGVRFLQLSAESDLALTAFVYMQLDVRLSSDALL